MRREEVDLLKVGVLFVELAGIGGEGRGVTGEQNVTKDRAGGGILQESNKF